MHASDTIHGNRYSIPMSTSDAALADHRGHGHLLGEGFATLQGPNGRLQTSSTIVQFECSGCRSTVWTAIDAEVIPA